MEEPKQKPKFHFEPLGAKHDRAAFSCGDAALDKFLKTQANQDAEKNLAVVFICTTDGAAVAGYFTLSQYSVSLDTIPEEISQLLTKHKQLPTTLIGRLARSTAFAGTGLGEILLLDALRKCLQNSRRVASWAVIVDAKNDAAVVFYKKYGFVEFPKVPNRLFLPIRTVERILVEAGIDAEIGGEQERDRREHDEDEHKKY